MAKRNLDLSSRKERTREIIPVKVFDIKEINNHFQESLQDIENKFSFASELLETGKSEEAQDVWRTQIVFLESAFDFYMHEIVKLGIVSIFNSDWDFKTEKYKNLPFSMSYLERAISDKEGDLWLKDWINERYRSTTLMAHENLKNVCNLLGLNLSTIADSVFYERNDDTPTCNKLKNFMDNLYSRRNQIAHQSDRRMEDAVKEKIEESDVKNYIEKMKKIVDAICTEIEQKSNSD